MDMDFIRKRITELRLAKGVSELAMSQALGHGRAYITHITSGRANPSVPELLYIIEYLDVTPRTFFSEGNENDSRQYWPRLFQNWPRLFQIKRSIIMRAPIMTMVWELSMSGLL